MCFYLDSPKIPVFFSFGKTTVFLGANDETSKQKYE